MHIHLLPRRDFWLRHDNNLHNYALRLLRQLFVLLRGCMLDLFHPSLVIFFHLVVFLDRWQFYEANIVKRKNSKRRVLSQSRNVTLLSQRPCEFAFGKGQKA